MKSFIDFQKEEVELNEGDHFDKADHHWDLSNHHDELASSHAEQGDVKKELSHKIKAETHMGKYHDHMSKFQKSRGSDSGGSSEEHNKWSAASSKNKAKLQAKLDKMNEEVELDEATVKTQKYSWGTMKTVHQGSDFSIPLHPGHHQEIAKLKDQQEHKFKDETGRHWTAKRSGDDVHFKGANGGNSTTVKHSTMSEEVELDEVKMSDSDVKFNDAMNAAHAKGKTNEEIDLEEEQLDEARGKVVASYIQKAKEAMKKKIDMKRKTAQLNDPNSAEKKIVKESDLDEEQLDELSKDTLASYEKKSRVAAHKHALASELKGLAADPAGSYAHKMMADKRHAGWKVAVKKLHTEESDTPFDGPYKQSKGTVTDKSGAKHTPLSNVRSLARNAIEKMKQKIRMAHLSPEVKAEKLARNEELVGGQKKLDIDKDGKIEKSDLEVLRAKKLKEDVTTAAQKLKAALDRHTEHAVAANRAGDHEAVKVHQEYANKIKNQLGKLAKNEEVEQLGESGGPVVYKKGNHHIEKYGEDSFALYKDGKKQRYYTSIENAKSAMDEGHQIVATTKEGETFKSGIHPTKEKALSQYYKMSKSGNYKKIDTIKTEEVEIKEAEMTDAEMAKREKIVKGMKKSFKDFTTKYGDRAKEVMYATATKKAMEEEVEEELEEDMDEGVTTRNGAVTVHKGTYGTSYQPNDDEDDEDTPEKKEPAVKRGRGRPAGAKSGAKPKGSSAGKSYGGVAIHSLRLPNNNK